MVEEKYSLPHDSVELYGSFHEHRFYKDSFAVLAGNGNIPLFKKVGEILDIPIEFPGKLFPNGEREIKIEANLRGRDVFVLQSMYPDADRHLQEAVLIGETINRADAGKTRALISKIAYDRQDRKSESRTPISIAAVANQLKTAGAYHSLLTIDIHAEQSQATFNGPWDNIYGSKVLIPSIKKQGLKDIVVLAPDAGSAKRAEKYAKRLNGADVAAIFKTRRTSSKTEVLFLAGDVQNRDVVIVDDVAATGSSLLNAAVAAKEKGARRVIAAVTHAELVKDSKTGETLIDKLKESDCPLDKFLTTDTIDQNALLTDNRNVEVSSVAGMLAVAIMCYLTNNSISKRLIN